MDNTFNNYKNYNTYDNDENHGQYCENCHIATGDCECPKDSCDICEDSRDETPGINLGHELAGGLVEPSY
jgi:hypothetical protein